MPYDKDFNIVPIKRPLGEDFYPIQLERMFKSYNVPKLRKLLRHIEMYAKDPIIISKAREALTTI